MFAFLAGLFIMPKSLRRYGILDYIVVYTVGISLAMPLQFRLPFSNPDIDAWMKERHPEECEGCIGTGKSEDAWTC